MTFSSLIQKIAERIAETEAKRVKLAAFVKEVSPSLKKTALPSPLKNIKIAAVDGGLVKKSLHGMDCLLVRAAAVCFHYAEGKVKGVQYFPSRNPVPRPEIYESLSEIDWNQFSSLNRLQEEIKTATTCLEAFQPDLLLLDGMILPHYLDRPAKSSLLYPLFASLMQSYASLFREVLKRRVALAGVIEDSRNIVFCDFLNTEILSKIAHPLVPELKQLLAKTRDSNLLYLVLEKGERTRKFPLSNPLSVDFNLPLMETFYLKTARFDRPLKIDFLSQTTNEDELSSTLLAVSGHHSSYGLPIPLIEADNVAKLPETEMENFYANILSLTGRLASTLKLRREERPF